MVVLEAVYYQDITFLLKAFLHSHLVVDERVCVDDVPKPGLLYLPEDV
jgi:hypothetical protein